MSLGMSNWSWHSLVGMLREPEMPIGACVCIVRHKYGLLLFLVLKLA